MLALSFGGKADLKLRQVPKPVVSSGDILVEVQAAAVCASDLRIFRGEKKARTDIVLGHEVSGTIAEMGSKVRGFEVGDRVAIYPVRSCGGCLYCQLGSRNMCPSRETLGQEFNGGFAEYVLIPEDMVMMGNVVKVPPGLTMEEAALAEPLSCSINGIEVLQIKVGEEVLIIGAGPMGLMLMFVAKASGAGKVIQSEIDEKRLNIAKMMGADAIIHSGREDLVERVKEETDGLGVDAVVVTIGLTSVIEESIKTARKKGRINLFAGSPPDSVVQIDPNSIHYRMITLTASQNAILPQFKRGLALMASGRVDLKPLITHKFPLRDARSAFEKRVSHEALKPEIIPQL